MNVSLNNHFNKFIEDELKTGRYQSVSEVVRAGLRLLEEDKHQKQAELNFYEQAVAEGLNSGEAKEWNLQTFLKKAQDRSDLNEPEI